MLIVTSRLIAMAELVSKGAESIETLVPHGQVRIEGETNCSFSFIGKSVVLALKFQTILVSLSLHPMRKFKVLFPMKGDKAMAILLLELNEFVELVIPFGLVTIMKATRRRVITGNSYLQRIVVGGRCRHFFFFLL